MTSLWTGSKVRLRRIEPEDWQCFMRFDENSTDMRSVDLIYPPHSSAGYRHWAAGHATAEAVDDEFQLAVESLCDQVLVGGLSTTSNKVFGDDLVAVMIDHLDPRKETPHQPPRGRRI